MYISDDKEFDMTKNYKIVYRIKGNGKSCSVTNARADSKKEVREMFDSSVVIKSIHTLEEWNKL